MSEPATRALWLYLLTQTEVSGYDTYSGAIVCAENAKAAKAIHPSEFVKSLDDWEDYSSWASSPKNVTAKRIGIASPGVKLGRVLTSFHAG